MSEQAKPSEVAMSVSGGRRGLLRRRAGELLLAAAALLGLYTASQYSYLLFHTIGEMFSIIVACGIFMIAWNSRSFVNNAYFLLLGIAYLFVGALDLLHTLAYTGMRLFPGSGTNLPAQLWIGSRYVESLSLLVAPALMGRRLKANALIVGYAAVFSILVASVFYWKVFPVCFVEGAGLTAFKVNSEYVISAILLGSLFLLFWRRRDFDARVLALLAGSIVVTIASELFFTLYADPYGPASKAGHFLKIVSFYLIYKAIIETSLKKPYDFLFRNLKQSERRLRDERNRAREYLNIAGAMIVVLGPDQRVSLINRRGCELLGDGAESIIGLNWFDTFVPARNREREKQRFARLLAGQAEPVFFFECPVICRTGEEKIVAWHDTILKDENGAVTAALASGEDITEIRGAEEALRAARDELEQRVRGRTRELADAVERLQAEVTDRVRAEMALRETNQLLERMFAGIHLGIAYMDRDLNFIRVNRTYAEADAREPEFFVGKNHFELYPNEENEAIFRRVVETGQPFITFAKPFEYPQHPERGVTYWDWSLQPVHDASGRVSSLVLALLDVTEHKRAEAARDAERRRLFSLMEELPAFVYLQGANHVVRFTNRFFREHFGNPEGKRCFEILRGRQQPCKDCAALRALESQVPQNRECHYVDGRVYHVHYYAFTDIDGSPLVLELGIDITERKRLEREISEISETEQRRIGQDLHDVLGQNLTGIGFLSKVLQQRLAAKSLAEAAYGEQIVKLVNQAVIQTRSLARGLCPVGLEADGLMTALKEYASNVESLFGVSCIFDCDEPVLVEDAVVATHLYHIAQEGVSNAVKHAKAEHIVISLSGRDDRVALAVRDDGVGLPEELDKSSGMGLRIMGHRASAIGGSLDIQSDADGGTVVVCLCPNARAGQ